MLITVWVTQFGIAHLRVCRFLTLQLLVGNALGYCFILEYLRRDPCQCEAIAELIRRALSAIASHTSPR